MPFFIKSDSVISSFPDECPFCSLRMANTKFRQTFSKMKLGKIPGSAVSKTIKLLLPGCEECSKWFRHTRFALFISGFFALLAPILSVFLAFEMPKYLNLAYILWVISIVLWGALLIFRKLKGSKFKIAYFSDKEFVYAGRNEKYISELAKINGTNYEKKAFIMRIA